jgi:hypothetical protein
VSTSPGWCRVSRSAFTLKGLWPEALKACVAMHDTDTTPAQLSMTCDGCIASTKIFGAPVAVVLHCYVKSLVTGTMELWEAGEVCMHM